MASVREALSLARPGARVLEAGSGTGRMTVELAGAVRVEAVGVDAEPEAVALGERLATAHEPLAGTARFVVGDIYDLPFGDGAFDLVLSDSVVEHLERPLDALREVARVLASGGHAVVAVPNAWRPDGWDLHRRLARPPYPQRSFSPPALRRATAEAGLTFVRFFGDELWLERNLGLLRARLLRASADDRPGPGNRADGTPVRSSVRLRRRAATLARLLLPARLHVNIGIVARKP